MTGRRWQSANEIELNSSNHLRFLQEDDLGMSKICVICNEDCSNEPRFKNEDGRYVHQKCFSTEGHATQETAPTNTQESSGWLTKWLFRPNQPRTFLNRIIGFILIIISIWLVIGVGPSISVFFKDSLDTHKEAYQKYRNTWRWSFNTSNDRRRSSPVERSFFDTVFYITAQLLPGAIGLCIVSRRFGNLAYSVTRLHKKPPSKVMSKNALCSACGNPCSESNECIFSEGKPIHKTCLYSPHEL